jgi:hypothetical protein
MEEFNKAGKTYVMQGREIWNRGLPYITLALFFLAYLSCYTLTTDTADYFETSTTLYRAVRCQIPEGCSLDGVHHCWNLRCHILTELNRIILVRYKLIYRCNWEIESVSQRNSKRLLQFRFQLSILLSVASFSFSLLIEFRIQNIFIETDLIRRHDSRESLHAVGTIAVSV